MRAAHYAKALQELTAAGKISEGMLMKQFVSTVAQNGHAHLFPKIVRSLERIERREEKKATIEVTSAMELTAEKVAALLKQEPFKQAIAPGHKKVIRKIDETLVGGTVVRTGTLKIDASHKHALLDLYQSLISS